MTDRRCTAHTTSGRPCRNPPIKGTTVCRVHGGSAPQVRKAAARRAAQLDAHQAAERMLAEAGVDADPIEHLVDSLRRTAALAIVYGQMVADLDHATTQDDTGQPRGTLGYREAPKSSNDELRVEANDRLLGLDRHGAATLHPFVVEYHRLLEVRAKLAKMAIDAGVEERRVQIAEEQGQVIVQVLRATLEDLGVEVTPEVASTVGRHLRSIEGGRAA